MVKIKELARRYVYCKNIDKGIEVLVKYCPECATVRKNTVKVPIHFRDEPTEN